MLRWWRGRHHASDQGKDPIAREKERALKLFGEQPAEDLHPYAPPPGPVQTRTTAPQPTGPEISKMTLVAFGIVSGAVIGLFLLADDPDSIWADARKGAMVASGSIGYLNCAHARLVGAAPLKKGDKGYTKTLDVDGDGVACEPIIPDETDKGGAAQAEDKPAKKKR
jgi:hypothetical protein